MSGRNIPFIVRAIIFALGMAILLFSVFSVVLSAAYLIAYSPQYIDTNLYIGVAVQGGAIGSGIGSLLVFIGWHAEEAFQMDSRG
ncbi:MAG: hypothetical protein EAX87_06070 [Candidatus Thorarchaeota archaeon]|nr:hypothetical protein [Candidatus Thorarchaeota archaeon]